MSTGASLRPTSSTDDVKGDYERIKGPRRRVHHAAYRRDRLKPLPC